MGGVRAAAGVAPAAVGAPSPRLTPDARAESRCDDCDRDLAVRAGRKSSAGRAAGPGARPGRGADPRRGRRRQSARRHAAEGARTRRRRAPAICPASRWRVTSSRIGAGVRDWRVGDRVCALVAGGGYATLCVAPAPQCLPIPRGMDLVDARRRSRKRSSRCGRTCSSAAGCRRARRRSFMAAPAASAPRRSSWPSARGARVFATAGSDEKCRACEAARRGARDQLPDARISSSAVRDLTGGRGVDLILDIVGGSYVARNLAALAMDGRLVQIGLMDGDATASIDFRRVLGRRLTITGSTLRPRSVAEKGAIAAALTARGVAAAREGRGGAGDSRGRFRCVTPPRHTGSWKPVRRIGHEIGIAGS